jgi:hypothetical protein
VGCEARKIPAAGGVFFLDFYLYRTNWEAGFQTTVPATEKGTGTPVPS